MMRRSRPRMRAAQEAYWPESAMWTEPGTWATANSIAGRVSRTMAPSDWRRRTSGALRGAGGGSWLIEDAPVRLSSTSRPKDSGRGGGEAVGEEMDELFFAAGEEGVVGAALLAYGGGALRAHLAAAERAGSVGG